VGLVGAKRGESVIDGLEGRRKRDFTPRGGGAAQGEITKKVKEEERRNPPKKKGEDIMVFLLIARKKRGGPSFQDRKKRKIVKRHLSISSKRGSLEEERPTYSTK